MDKILVVVFDNEAKAYEGSKALQDLQAEGFIDLYAKAVIKKGSNGQMTVLQEGDMGPAGTAVGLMIGSLAGMIAGPVGVIIGSGVGTFGGIVYDLAHLGVDQEFLQGVLKSLDLGKTAVVAEIWEEWMLPVNTRLESLGGVDLRCSRKEVLDDLIERDIASLKVELDELEAEYHRSVGEARAKLQKQVDATRGRLQAAQDDIVARVEASQLETDAKIKALQQQAARDSDEWKAKRQTRIAELQADQKRRNNLLKKAWELTKEALSQ